MVRWLRRRSTGDTIQEGTIWLRGPEYGGMAIHDVPAALLNDLNVPPLNAGERPPG